MRRQLQVTVLVALVVALAMIVIGQQADRGSESHRPHIGHASIAPGPECLAAIPVPFLDPAPQAQGPARAAAAKPASYAHGVEIRAEGHPLKMRLVEAIDLGGQRHVPADIQAAMDREKVRYPDILPNVDSLVVSTESEIEEWLEIRSPMWRTASWLFEVEGLRVIERDGTLVAVDETDRALLRMKPLAYETSLGEQGIAQWTWNPEERVLAVEVPQSAGSVLLDPGWVNTGSLTNGRYSHTATLLPNCGVLAAGGRASAGATTSCEVFDTKKGTWSATGSLANARRDHTVTMLATGRPWRQPGTRAGRLPGRWSRRASCTTRLQARGVRLARSRLAGSTLARPCCATGRSCWRGATTTPRIT